MIRKHPIKQYLSKLIKLLNESALARSELSTETIINTLSALISPLLRSDEKIHGKELNIAANSIASGFDTYQVDKIKKLLKKKYTEEDIKDAVSKFSSLKEREKENLIYALLEFAIFNTDFNSQELNIISLISSELSISASRFNTLKKEAIEKSVNKQSIFESTTGIVCALIIIFLFIIAITYLKSVVFGLILAYFFLPLQEWFKNRILKTATFYYISKSLYYLILPIIIPYLYLRKFLPFKLKKYLPDSEKDKKTETEKKLINYSCILTVFSVITFFMVFLASISLISTYSFASLTQSVSHWTKQVTENYQKQKDKKDKLQSSDGKSEKTPIKKETSSEKESLDKQINESDNNSTEELFQALIYKFQSLKPKIENSVFFKPIKNYVNKYFSDPESLQRLISRVFTKTGGIFSYTANAIGIIFSLLMSLIFTFFFFGFFLNQMAKLSHKMGNDISAGEYIVESILLSNWFPITNKNTQKTTVNIINDILIKLKAWVRGYLTIIIIETVYYITTFLLAGVPYATILGSLAGITILLPYLGPVLSFILTASVCLVIGNGSMIQILIIIVLYIIMNGIIEQLFLYPGVVGGALGLNEFETIIFVLIGSLLAGIPGLVFAVPVASIVKYLIPKIYSIWDARKERFKNLLNIEDGYYK